MPDLDVEPPHCSGFASQWQDARPFLEGNGPALQASEVHVWLVNLDRPVPACGEPLSILSGPERERAARFVFDRDRARFVAARAALRRLLGRYTGIAPERIEFDYGAEGKPRLRGSTAAAPLQFNLSHSAGWALLGITHAGSIGVDIEAHRDVPEAEAIARSNFAPEEIKHFVSLPTSMRVQAFFECWTRKEAYVKAIGGGLSVPLDRFVVSFASSDNTRFVSIDGSHDVANRWTLHDCEIRHGLTAAVALHATSARFLHLVLA